MNGDLKITHIFKQGLSDSQGCVCILVKVNGGQFRMTLNHLMISPKDWNTKSGMPISNTKEAQSIKEKLSSISIRLFRIYKEIQIQGMQVSAQELKRHYFSASQKSVTDIITQYNSTSMLTIGKTITLEDYRRQLEAVDLIKLFNQHTYGVSEISVSALPDTFPEKFMEFLSETNPGSANNQEYCQFMFSLIIKECKKENICISKDLVQQLKQYLKPSQPITGDVIEKMANNHLPNHLSIIAEAFIFSHFTGLNYTIIKELTRKDIRVASDQTLWLFKFRTRYSLSALPENIQNRIRSLTNASDLFILPTIQQANANLKKITSICNIDFRLTFSSARK